jgi:hypothetical protein
VPGVGPQAPFCLGIDLGTSGLRLALIDAAGLPVEGGERALPYPQPFEQPGGWRSGLVALVQALPAAWRQQVVALSVDGTSGTLLACRTDGEPLGEALSYALACPEQAAGLAELVETGSPAGSSSSSLARALRLLQAHALQKPPLLFRHQADWVMAPGAGGRKATTSSSAGSWSQANGRAASASSPGPAPCQRSLPVAPPWAPCRPRWPQSWACRLAAW